MMRILIGKQATVEQMLTHLMEQKQTDPCIKSAVLSSGTLFKVCIFLCHITATSTFSDLPFIYPDENVPMHEWGADRTG